MKRNWVTLEEISSAAKKKFGGEFNETLLLQQLSYFDDIEKVGIDFIGKAYTEKEVKNFLEEQVERQLQKYWL